MRTIVARRALLCVILKNGLIDLTAFKKHIYFRQTHDHKLQRTSLQNSNVFKPFLLHLVSKSGLIFGNLSTPFTLASSRFLSFRGLAYPCTIDSITLFDVRLPFNYFDFHRFPRHLKNARSKRTIVPFLDLLLSHSPLIESFCRSTPDHF